jgi:SAM-dependent methyltransferase
MDDDRWQGEEQDSFAWRRVWDLLDIQKTPCQSILDVGAFTGGFLSGIPENWQRCAIEPSENARTELQAKGIETVVHLLEPPKKEFQDMFDVVTMFDVFEHLPDPLISLGNLLKWIRPGGKLIISTGNFDHWTWRFLRGKHWYMDPAQHLCIGSTRFFRKWAKRHGLTIRTVEKIPHGHSDIQNQIKETLIVIYFSLRGKPSILARVGYRFLQNLPALKSLRHKDLPPYTRSLHDHLLLVVEKPS